MAATPIFSVLLCRMRNGTVAKLRTHTVQYNADTDKHTYEPLALTPRQCAVIHNAERVTALDNNGNARQQTRKNT